LAILEREQRRILQFESGERYAFLFLWPRIFYRDRSYDWPESFNLSNVIEGEKQISQSFYTLCRVYHHLFDHLFTWFGKYTAG
jgi:hypothetical protein